MTGIKTKEMLICYLIDFAHLPGHCMSFASSYKNSTVDEKKNVSKLA